MSDHFTLHHVSLFVRDVDASAAFYANVLGLGEIPNRVGQAHIRWFTIDGFRTVHLIGGDPEAERPRPFATHLAFATRNFETALTRLEQHGVTYVSVAGQAKDITVRADGIRQIYFQDPDGHWIEINDANARALSASAKQRSYSQADALLPRLLVELSPSKGTFMIARLVLGCALAACALPAAASDRATIDALVAQHAKAHGVPEALVHRVIQRESSYNPRASSRGNLGLMQIRYDTALGMGYTGPASGLLDADTNLTYAVPYLANAYRVAGGSPDYAMSLYTGGYYYIAKRKGLLRALRTAASGPVSVKVAAPSSSWPSPLFTPPEPR